MRVLMIAIIATCISAAATVDVGYDEVDVTPFSC